MSDESADKLERRLRELATAWAVPVSAPTQAALLSYGALLLSWNAKINLTGAKSLVELVETHFPDAFALAARLGDRPARVVDVGSGGGLPALPLALLAPAVEIVMFEPVAKKAAFLRTAIRELGLGGRVRIEARRLDAGPSDDDDGDGDDVGYDAAMSRATFAPEEWMARAQPLVRPGGRVFVLASRRIDSYPQGLTLEGAAPYLDGRRWLIALKRST